MSDGISRIELKNSTGYGRYRDSEQEESGLLGTGTETLAPLPAPGTAPAGYDEEGLLPVMIEHGLEKMGML